MGKRFRLKEVHIKFLLFVVILVVFALIQPKVFTAINLFSMLNDAVFTGIVALGMMVIMVTGNLDLSSTSIGMMSGYMMLRLFQMLGYAGDFVTAFIVSGIFGALLGMLSGYLSKKFNLSGFVVSIGMDLIYSSIAFIFIDQPTIKTAEMPQNLLQMRTASLLTIKTDTGLTAKLNIGILLVIIVAIILSIFLNKTQLGRGIYALGGDKVAVERVGYNPMKLTLVAYAVFGACCGIAATYFYCNTGSFETGTITSRGTDVITAAIFGGCNMKDGKGSVSGILVGVAIITAIKSNLILLGVPAYYITCVVGLLILGGVLFSTLAERRLQKA